VAIPIFTATRRAVPQHDADDLTGQRPSGRTCHGRSRRRGSRWFRNDKCYGDGGNDRVFGGPGADVLSGGFGTYDVLAYAEELGTLSAVVVNLRNEPVDLKTWEEETISDPTLLADAPACWPPLPLAPCSSLNTVICATLGVGRSGDLTISSRISSSSGYSPVPSMVDTIVNKPLRADPTLLPTTERLHDRSRNISAGVLILSYGKKLHTSFLLRAANGGC